MEKENQFIPGKWYRCICNENYYRFVKVVNDLYFVNDAVINPNNEKDGDAKPGYTERLCEQALLEYFTNYTPVDDAIIEKYLPVVDKNPEFVEYVDGQYKGQIVKVLSWNHGSWCEVEFPDGTIAQPYKYLVRPYEFPNYEAPFTENTQSNEWWIDLKKGDVVKCIANKGNTLSRKIGESYIIHRDYDGSINYGSYRATNKFEEFELVSKATDTDNKVSYVGRYLKALVDCPQSTPYKIGEYIKITANTHNHYDVSLDNTDYGANIDSKDWKLMPEGFEPDVEETLLEQAERLYPIGAVYKPLSTENIDYSNTKIHLNFEEDEYGVYERDVSGFIYLKSKNKWVEIITEAKEFVLPEKWCLKTDEKVFVDYCNKNGLFKYTESELSKNYAHFPWKDLGYCTSDKIAEGYTEITFEQFEKYVAEIDPTTNGSSIGANMFGVIVNEPPKHTWAGTPQYDNAGDNSDYWEKVAKDFKKDLALKYPQLYRKGKKKKLFSTFVADNTSVSQVINKVKTNKQITQ